METLGEGNTRLFVERLGSSARVTRCGRPGCLCYIQRALHRHFGGTALEARCAWNHLLFWEGEEVTSHPEPMGGGGRFLPHA